jgi:hypothetical protein
MKTRLNLPFLARASFFAFAVIALTGVLQSNALATTTSEAARMNFPDEQSPISFMGEFSNVRHTAEHAYGYSVQLWRQGDKIFGLFTAASGLVGDVPCGVLQDVSFNSATGALSFTAKLSVASIYLGKGRQEPTHDLFSFKGTLQGAVLAGSLTHLDQMQPKSKPISKRLRLSRTSNPPSIDAATHEDWKRAADAIMKFRGPKW